MENHSKRIEYILSYFKELAQKTIDECGFVKNTDYCSYKGENLLLLPSGDEKYISFWVRDCAMMAESGLIKNEDLKRYVTIIAENGQNDRDILYFENALEIPPYAVADHVNYNGRPVYFPGTYSDSTNQGNGTFGFYPPLCDNYCFIMMAGYYIKQSGDIKILDEVFNAIKLSDRLVYAFEGYNIDPETELCYSSRDKFTIDWGFCDTIHKDGLLLMPSLFRYNAAKLLEGIFANDKNKSDYYKNKARTIAENIINVFYDEESGWLFSATGTGHQHDVWATAYAVYIGITDNKKTLKCIYDSFVKKTAVIDGYIRHIPNNEDYSDNTSWESAISEYNTYQNGAYWATPLGWYIKALYMYDREAAYKICEDFIAHTEKYKHDGAPYEWINKDTTNLSGRNYGTSGVLPYAGFAAIVNGEL